MKSPAQAHLIALGLALIVALGGYALWLRETEAAKASALEMSGRIAAATAEHARAGSNRDETALLEEEEEALARRTVSTTDIVPFLESLESVGSGMGAAVTVVSVSNPAPDGKITLSLSVRGPFDAVMRTVGAVEFGEHASAVRSLTLDAAGEAGWSAAVTVIVLSSP